MISARFSLAVLLLGCNPNHDAFAQPIIYDGYRTEIFANVWMPKYFCGDPTSTNDDKFACYTDALLSRQGMPSTAEYLAMFSDKFVEINGRFFTVKNAQNTGGFPFNSKYPNTYDWNKNGLYEVVDAGIGYSCVNYNLIYEDDNIGQIVASSQFDPIQIIGVDQVSNKIYGYYQSNGVWSAWTRDHTNWGDAKDGSLVAGPAEDGEVAGVVGLSTNDRLFTLWGDFSNFNYHKNDDIQCAATPASIDDWTGFWAGSRGVYCPGAGNNQLRKYTWHGSGSTTDELIWMPAAKIARLGPKSNIFGVSMGGELLTLWDQKGVAVHSLTLSFPELTQVRSLGGLDDGYARGIFVSNDQDKVYNVYWEGDWKTKEINISYNEDPGDVTLFFGNRDGKTYLFYGWLEPGTGCKRAKFYLYRLNFVGGNDRYEAELLDSDEWVLFCGSNWNRKLKGHPSKERRLC